MKRYLVFYFQVKSEGRQHSDSCIITTNLYITSIPKGSWNKNESNTWMLNKYTGEVHSFKLAKMLDIITSPSLTNLIIKIKL